MAREYAARNKRPPPKKAGLPPWVWAFVGLSVGLAVAAFVYISRPTHGPLRGTAAATNVDARSSVDDGENDTPPAPSSMPATHKRGDAGDKDAHAKTDKIEVPPREKSRFTFYELLPSQEVLVPSQAPPKPGTQAAPPPPRPTEPAPVPASVAAAAAAASTSSSSATVDPKAPAAAPGVFIIQVASYRAQADAEKQKAGLALLGLESHVEKVTIDNRDTWYRVRIGPVKEEARARDMLTQLEANDISGMLVRVK